MIATSGLMDSVVDFKYRLVFMGSKAEGANGYGSAQQV